MDDYAEFRHLKYLLAIIEHKGVRAAAEALNITAAFSEQTSQRIPAALQTEVLP